MNSHRLAITAAAVPGIILGTCLIVGHWARCPERSRGHGRCVLARGHARPEGGRSAPGTTRHIGVHGRGWTKVTVQHVRRVS